ncbi:hypothetical protein C472_04173 [Halorubrum tebenquichense DSM 14210]|uniref:Uncharacterized protein n=1 Tax=Halorubrum tebenquichense DSM 14210 TaxID=1227485 RepID=M0DZG8_9EURY|nr:hypothetical protein C472_04173 [Halorubrum tebenquichense DSM 14210]
MCFRYCIERIALILLLNQLEVTFGHPQRILEVVTDDAGKFVQAVPFRPEALPLHFQFHLMVDSIEYRCQDRCE